MATEYFEFKVSTVQAGQHAQCVFHYRIIDPTESNDYVLASQLLQALDDGAPSWLTEFRDMMSDDAFISSVRAKRLKPLYGNSAVQFFQPATLPGTVALPCEALQTAAVIVWLSDTDPSDTGRNFIPGVPSDALDASRWDAAHYTRVENFIAKHLPGFSVAAGIFEPVIYKVSALTGRLMSHGYLSPKPGVIRRREVPI